jgi:hypothetical protein
LIKTRRTIATVLEAIALIGLMSGCDSDTADNPSTVVHDETRKPNVVFVLTDQWRAQATGYSGDPNLIGKWHLDGMMRDQFTPPERRQGFEYWKALECSHEYNQLFYYEGDSPEKKQWEGYGP